MNKISIGIPQCQHAEPFKEFFEKFKQDNYVINYGDFNFLSNMLKEKIIHVGLVSLTDYLKNAKDYHIFQSACISANKASNDYVLFSKYKLEDLDGKTIFVPYVNADAQALLSIILKEANIEFNFRAYKKIDEEVDIILGTQKAVINEFKSRDYYQYDLIQLWSELTNLPFLLGLWVCNKDWKESSLKEYELTRDYLSEAIVSIKNNNISYNFTQLHIETLYKFRDKIVCYKL